MSDTSTEFCDRLAHDCELGRWALGSTFPSGQAILDDCAKTLRSLATERDTLRAALESIEREYDPSEYGVNAQTMYDIAHAALNAKDAPDQTR